MGGGNAGQAAQDLCLPALEYLKRCCQILSKMWTMPACPVFNGAQRYNIITRWRLLSRLRPRFLDQNGLKQPNHLLLSNQGWVVAERAGLGPTQPLRAG